MAARISTSTFDWEEYQRAYRASHPEKTEEWRANTAFNTFERYILAHPDRLVKYRQRMGELMNKGVE